MKLRLSQALAVLQYLDDHPSEFNDEDRARIKRIIADVPFANLMHEARVEARQREKDRALHPSRAFPRMSRGEVPAPSD
jgi:hypothetical protein